MKKALIYLVFSCCSIVVCGQCPTTNVICTTQSEIDSFPLLYPNCTNLTVDLTIDGISINSLSSFNQLTEIGALLTVRNTAISDFDGLENVSTVGQMGAIVIRDNTNLSNISGLANIVGFDRSILIRNNPNLTSLSGIEWLVNCTSINIIDNSTLSDLSGLNNLTTADAVFIRGGAFTDLTGLENLISVSSFFSLINNASLTDISALNSNLNVGSINILNNGILSDCAIQAVCNHLDNGGTTNISGNAPGCSSVSEVTAACATVLPVELIDFKGTLMQPDVFLQWSTASEFNNKIFEVEWKHEHSNWEKIGSVDGRGTSIELNQYLFIHKTPLRGENYYRLRQVDFDDAFEYSAIISVKLKEAIYFGVFPNPANDEITIQSHETEGVINLYNTTGQLLKKKNVTSLNQKVDISDLQSDLYLIEYKSETQRIIKRILKI
jgi:Receptor L domain.